MRELLLISQDTTFFGIDRGERGALARLLRRLNDVAGLEWIRLLYLYPTTITDDVLDAMAECEKVCNYIDLPLQHASADVLRRMRRPGNREAYDKLLARIRARVPGVTLRTTFIVGFPGETEQDFEELLRVRPRHRLRSRRRLHLLARGRHARLRDGRRRAGGGQGGAARPRSCSCRSGSSRQRPEGAASATRVASWSTARRRSRELVLHGPARRARRPTSTPMVVPRRVRPVDARRRATLVRPRSHRRAGLRPGCRRSQRPSCHVAVAAEPSLLYFRVVLAGKAW